MDLCSHTNSSSITECLMGDGSPYSFAIIIIGLIMWCFIWFLLGLRARDKILHGKVNKE